MPYSELQLQLELPLGVIESTRDPKFRISLPSYNNANAIKKFRKQLGVNSAVGLYIKTPTELTFEQQQKIDEIAQKAYTPSSNSNKHRYELYAYIDSIILPLKQARYADEWDKAIKSLEELDYNNLLNNDELHLLIFHRMEEMLENPYANGIYRTSLFMASLKQDILKWKDMCILEAIDKVLDKTYPGGLDQLLKDRAEQLNTKEENR